MSEEIQEKNQEKKWYEKAEWIYVLVILFWPVGLFLLWKSKDIPKKNKLLMTGVFIILLILALVLDEGKMFNKIDRIFRIILG